MARGQNLLSKVYNKPLLITLDDLQPIADYLSSPERVASLKFEQETLVSPKLEDYSLESEYQKAMMQHLDINPETMTGILHIDGVLVNREGQMNSQCVELTSYQGLKKRFEMQVEQGIKSCVLMISSGGGEAFGAWSTASYVKKIAKENNVRLTTYINGNACSAAYVWAVVADEVISHPMGSSGSIGVLVQLYNDSKMLENLGVQRSFVYAGGNKIPFDKEGSFTDKFISDLQASVDKTYSKFVQHVSQNRGMSDSQVIGTNASVFDADEALSLGLIDKIMELEDFELQYGIKVRRSNGNGVLLQTPEHIEKSKQEDNMSQQLTVEAVQAQLSAALEEKQTLTAQLAEASEKLTELTEAKESLSTELTALKEAKESLVAEKAALEAEKLATEKQARLDSRTAKLEASLGKDNEKVAELLTTTESLSDEQFEVIASSFGVAQEAKQDQFAEKGGEGQQSNTQLTIEQKLAAKAKSMNKQSA